MDINRYTPAVFCAGDVLVDSDGHPITCNDGESIPITMGDYDAQMRNPDALWKCPKCRGNAFFDDDAWEASPALAGVHIIHIDADEPRNKCDECHEYSYCNVKDTGSNC